MKLLLAAVAAIVLIGCGDRVEQYVGPEQVAEFPKLFANNCAGCHGNDGRLGAARPLHDPLFLQVIGEQTLKEVITQGVPGRAMPAFAKSAGGDLTDQQITILVSEMLKRWSRPHDFTGVVLPSYRAEAGDPKAGSLVYRAHCANCHGEEGAKSIAGSVVDTSFLALVSDQSLRTTVIAGRADRGMPDARKHSPALTPQEVSDVVAWLSTHRNMPINLTQRGTQ